MRAKRPMPRNEIAPIIRRLLRILRELRRETFPNKAKLAKIAKVNERTIQRDIQLLRRLRVPIEFDRAQGGFYLTNRDWRLDD